MDLDALRFANFKLLDDAVEDWTSMVKDLDDLKEAAGKGLKGAADKAEWAGYNATVSREFIGKTAGEFADAHTQATSIRNILRDVRDELKDYKKKLEDAIDRGLKKNLTVTTTGGGGFTVTMNIHPDRAAKGTTVPEHSESDVTALRDEIQKILNEATERDDSANKVLQALVDQSRLGFSDASYSDRDQAADALKAADDLAALAKKKPEDLTVEEFDKLNAGLKKYANDDLFAEEFATKLGAEGTLGFWAGINQPGAAWELTQKRGDHFDDLQKNLSLTLATASQSDSADMSQWKYKMIEMVDQPINRNSPVLGAQVMTNLMRWGDYDDRFLTGYGDKLIETEKKATSNGRHGAWQYIPSDPMLNRTGTDSGWDPMTGYLRALSNSPDAATEFFNDSFLTKDEDHDFTEKNKDGKEVKRSLSNFEYLFEERDWPVDQDDKGEDSIAGRNNLAMALEAATTGHPAGELPTADTRAHNEGQTKLFESIVASVSDNNERLTDHSYMSDSMGQIASEYLPDINRAMTDDSDNDTDRLFPIAGSEAELNHRDVTRFLFTIAQNPEGYAATEVGQKAYMGNLMEYHLNPDLPKDQRYSEDPQFAVEQIAKGSGEVSGTLAQGRAEDVAHKAEERDKEYEHSVAQWKNVISGTTGAITGVGTSLIVSPVGGVVAGGVADTATSVILEQIFKDAEGKAKGEAGPVMGEHWESGLDSNSKYTETAAEAAAKNHHRDDLPDVGEWARDGAQRGFNQSGNSVSGMAADLKTDI
ncbi:hypothetical protein [Streptomyces minutiscleroticus]|uniref:hypothetical protein n=1 Tax=Streptomyces minutiscleroticus TaxID=68238 RepID=UPI003317156B